METLMKLPDIFTPDFLLLNDTLCVFLSDNDASMLRIVAIEAKKKELTNYFYRKKNEKIILSSDTTWNTSLSFYHPATRIFYDYQVEKGILTLADFTRLRLQKDTPFTALKADDKTVVGIGLYPRGLWGLYHAEKAQISFYGNYPVPPPYASKENRPFFEGAICRFENQYVYASSSFGYISSYIYEDGELHKLWERQLTDFLYEEKVSRVLIDSLNHNGFSDICMTENYIYALYNGYTEKTNWEERINSLLIFDRSGTPLAHYPFPDEMVYIDIDSQGKYLYATYSPLMHDVYWVRFLIPPFDKPAS